jgi:hypothetical protein
MSGFKVHIFLHVPTIHRTTPPFTAIQSSKDNKKKSAHNLTCQRGDYRARRSAHQRPRHRQRTEPENQHGRYELVIPLPE